MIHEVQYQIQSLIQQVAHMDKDTLVTVLYPIWLYILMDGATRMGSRKRAYSRHY